MRLVIKGSPKNAKREAARHGIPVRDCKPHPRFNETFCDAPESARGRVVRWFGKKETRGGRTGRGVAPGALLFFNGARARRRRRRR